MDPEKKKKKKKKPTQVRVQPEAHAEDERAARDRNKDAIMYILFGLTLCLKEDHLVNVKHSPVETRVLSVTMALGRATALHWR